MVPRSPVKPGDGSASAALIDPGALSCTIITTTANDMIAAFHDRMPVILVPTDYDLWLSPSEREPQRLLPLLKSYPAERMEAYPVASVVNSPANESPECVRPLKEA
jgi:putative SOS response-associated peptidase YedK